MTTVLALANQKGGVGKTTTAINLGAALAELGCATLVIDLDPQGNATASLGLKATEGKSTYELLAGEATLAEITLATTTMELWLAPSTPDLAGAEIELATAMAREYRLQRALAGAIEQYRFVIIDCPPAIGLLTINGLTAARDVVVPVQCEYLSLEGLTQFTATLEKVRRNLNHELRLSGVLLTMFDRRTKLAQQVAEEVRRHFPSTFRTVIPRSVRLSEAPSHGLPISSYDPDSAAAVAYRELAKEVLQAVEARVEVPS
ncbi:MAG: ParA family protein [Chloroflexi bacterium]|nr:ParA family protein [Chloroflexota bacterium]